MSESATDDAAPLRRTLKRRIFRALGMAALALVLFAVNMWAALAIAFGNLRGAAPRSVLATIYVVAVLVATLFARPRRYARFAGALSFLIVLGWFFSLSPSNDLDWLPDVANVASIDMAGDRVTVHNVRNFDYRSETDFTPRWEDRTYDLSKLRTVDLMLVYWGSPAIAHAMVSFEFDDGQHLSVSIETRKEKSESFSTIQGFFRQYELYYVFADERDVVRVRTNFRNEDVYLYRTNISRAHAVALFRTYAAQANKLAREPQFYNALTSNCATNVVANLRESNPKGTKRINWEIIASGYAARRAYENGRLDTSMPYETLRARSRVNDAAQSAGETTNFSEAIRVGLPKPPAADGER